MDISNERLQEMIDEHVSTAQKELEIATTLKELLTLRLNQEMKDCILDDMVAYKPSEKPKKEGLYLCQLPNNEYEILKYIPTFVPQGSFQSITPVGYRNQDILSWYDWPNVPRFVTGKETREKAIDQLEEFCNNRNRCYTIPDKNCCPLYPICQCNNIPHLMLWNDAAIMMGLKVIAKDI